MLSPETETKIIKLFLGIANGDQKIDKLKQNLLLTNQFNPAQIFMLLDSKNRGKVSEEEIQFFLSQFQIQCSHQEAKFLIYFYDSNNDGELEYPDVLNLLISDSDYLFKKIAKKKFGKAMSDSQEISPELYRGIATIFEKEVELSRYLTELITDVKESSDFSLQDMFHVIKSYSFITYERYNFF